MKLYLQLERRNDWGAETIGYWKDNARVGRDFQVVGENGGVVTVCFPDGSVEDMTLTLRKFTQTVPDHGHSYMVTSEIPGVTIMTRGLSVWMPLDTPGMRVGIDA